MPDERNANGNAQQPDQDPISVTLRETGKRLNDVLGLLRQQRDMLRQRGVNLPSGAMDGVRTLRKTVDALTKTIVDGRQELRSLRALAETTALINSAQQTDEVLNQVMDTVIALTGAERGYIVLKNKDTGELEFKVARGMDESSLEGGDGNGKIISTTIVNNVADSGDPVLTDNASMDERYESKESIVSFALRSILAVPLKVRDEVVGVVYCDNRFMAGLFKQSELKVLTAFANQAAVAIENARLFEAARMRLDEIAKLRDRMDNLFKSITSGVITIDQNDTILIANAAAHDILQYDGDMVNLQLTDVLTEVPAPLTRAIDEVRAAGKLQIADFDVVIDGRERSWSLIASALRGDDGNMQGVAMVIDDMTEQKKSESQIMAARLYLSGDIGDISNMQIEEREVTALFADVRGFTTFSENLAPEELMTVINKYLSLASDAIGLFEGVVDKYMGDAVTGLWNTQLNPQPDHAVRAVQSAMQLVLDLYAQHEVMSDDQRLFYGIGIHTGPAVLGNVGSEGRREFSALGEATDVCKFLQEQAGPGEIVISGETYEWVKDQYECERITDLARPTKAYAHITCYRIVKRKANSSSIFVDDELLALLAQDDDDE